jgi:diguanylate cyclase (GGDEF)-like protein
MLLQRQVDWVRRSGTDAAPSNLVANIEVANLSALVGMAGSLLLIALLLPLGLIRPIALNLCALAGYALTVWLNRRQHTRISRMWTGGLFLAQALSLTFLLSSSSGANIYLLCGIPVAFLLFAPEEPLTRAGAITLSVLAFALSETRGFHAPVEAITAGWLEAFYFVTLVSLFVGVAVIVERFGTVLNRLEAGQRALAATDELTGLASRRHLLAQASSTLRVALRYGRDFSVALIDVDHFKAVNDECGHLEGDRLLREVTACLDRNHREADLLGRYGGEEFVLLLPETSPGAACVVAERSRRSVESLRLDLGSGPRSVTVSLGVAGLRPGETADLDDLLKRADEALYRAKHTGRNRVHLWRAPDAESPVRVA